MLKTSLNLIKGWARYGVVGVRGLQCSMMGDLIQIRISCLTSLYLCPWNTKMFCKALVDAPIRFLIAQNRLKIKKIWGWN
jgi:hypothetical protein